MRQTKKASELVVGDKVVPPTARNPEEVRSTFVTEGLGTPYMGVVTPVRKWFVALDEDVTVDVPGEEV